LHGEEPGESEIAAEDADSRKIEEVLSDIADGDEDKELLETGWEEAERGEGGWEDAENSQGQEADGDKPAHRKQHVTLNKVCSTIVGCSTCGSTSDKIEWYDIGTALQDGQLVETPKGDACLPCGLATEAYPLLDRGQVVIKYNTDPEFRKAFQVS
jgi:hypothetical protein